MTVSFDIDINMKLPLKGEELQVLMNVTARLLSGVQYLN